MIQGKQSTGAELGATETFVFALASDLVQDLGGIGEGSVRARRSIADVGALSRYSLGLDVPLDFEGAVPSAMLTPENHARYSIREGVPARGSEVDTSVAAMSESEKDQMMAHLQTLGYVE